MQDFFSSIYFSAYLQKKMYRCIQSVLQMKNKKHKKNEKYENQDFMIFFVSLKHFLLINHLLYLFSLEVAALQY